MKGKVFNICNIFTLVFCIYHLKGWLYQQDIISIIMYGIVMLISAFYMLAVLRTDWNDPFIKSYTLLLIMFSVYGVINILFFDDINKSGHIIPNDFFLQNIVRSMIPFYAFYSFTKQGFINKRWLCWFALIFLLVCIPRYSISENKMLVLANRDEVTNNAGYFFCALIPLFCFFNKRPVIQYLGLGVCVLFVIMGMKRGAMLVTAISLVFFLINSLKDVSLLRKVIIVVFFIGLVAFAYEYAIKMFSNSEYFAQRYYETLEGNSSSREVLYDRFWHLFVNGDIVSFFIGYGADATIRLGPNFAHNDWLEIAVDHGILGLVFFLAFWKQMFVLWKKTRINNLLHIAFGICALQLFAKTWFSMAINDMEIYTTLIMGFSVAAISNDRLLAELE